MCHLVLYLCLEKDFMRIFKSKWFMKWANKQGIADRSLKVAVEEINAGLVDADLGGNVVKKRVAQNQGKRSGFRTILAFKAGENVFFIYGFTKNVRANVDARELIALKQLAKMLLSYNDVQLRTAIEAGGIEEVM